MAKLTDEQKQLVKDRIKSDPDLDAKGKAGRDADILAVLNAVDPAIDVPREPVTAAAMLALVEPGDVLGLTDTQTRLLGVLLTGGAIDLNSQPVGTVIDAMPAASKARMTAAKTRKGSWSEQAIGRQLDVNEISDVLKADRPDGQVKP